MGTGHCSICGNYSDNIGSYAVEGVQMEVCPNCSVFGKRAKNEKSPAQYRAMYAKLNSPDYKRKIKEFIKADKNKYADKFSLESGEKVVDDCAGIIRKIVHKNLWTNEEFAKKLNERESYVSQIISGHMRPSLELSKKIEKMFDVRLVESFDLSTAGNPASVSHTTSKSFDRMTFADVIKQAMEKKK